MCTIKLPHQANFVVFQHMVLANCNGWQYAAFSHMTIITIRCYYRVNDMVGWIKMLLRCSPCNKRKKEMDNKNKWINKYNLLLMCIVHKCHSWNLVGKKNATLPVVIVFGHSLIKVFGHSLIQVYVGHSLIKVYACSLFN